MDKYYIVVKCKGAGAQQEILIALLMDLGFEAVQEEEETLTAAIEESLYSANEVAAVFKQLSLSFTTERIAQQNWNAEWEKSFDPVLVDDYVAIRAAFHDAVPGVKHEIIITPQMSFGTGHHATTWLMISLMQSIPLEGKSVIDFGTGTGVLAILAEKEGAKDVLAIDCDEWSIRNAEENILANHCKAIALLQMERMTDDRKADIILANINLNVITANLKSIEKASVPGAIILLSGILESDVPGLSEILKGMGGYPSSVAVRNGWAAIRIDAL